jgi:hypothetical protein
MMMNRLHFQVGELKAFSRKIKSNKTFNERNSQKTKNTDKRWNFHLFVCRSICLSVWLSYRLLVCLPVCLFFSMFVFQSVCLSLRLYVFLPK